MDYALRRDSLTRRAMLGHGLVLGTFGIFSQSASLNAQGELATPVVSLASPETWRTWLLSSPDELRPAVPAAPTTAELDELRQLQNQRSVETSQLVEAWGGGPAVLPWTALTLDLIRVHKPSPVRAARALALVHTAIHDAVVATWDAKAAFPRPSPSALDQTIVQLGPETGVLSAFPSEHAAVAVAASTVLTYLFPAEPADGLSRLAEEAATSRLWSGRNVKSDVDAGLAIGQAVGDRAVARGKEDGSDKAWDGSGRPEGDGHWQPTPPEYRQEPVDPMAGTWQPWVLPTGDAYRPPPPPTWGSPAWNAELAAVQEAVARRTPEQEAAVHSWAGGPGTLTPAGIWTTMASDLIARDGLDLPHAARVLALTTVAMADAFVCCWDAKFTYWSARPITADSDLAVLIPTPPFPSYTSGHSTISAAAATMLGYLFQAHAANLADRALEARDSRLWSGIHFPVDNEMGAAGGSMIGRLVVARARRDELTER